MLLVIPSKSLKVIGQLTLCRPLDLEIYLDDGRQRCDQMMKEVVYLALASTS